MRRTALRAALGHASESIFQLLAQKCATAHEIDVPERTMATRRLTGAGAPSGRVLEFDGLRGVAISLVLLGHFAGFSIQLPGGWSAFAEVGVLLFFVLSGFLITSLLCAEEHSTPGQVNLRRFYLRRALRLLPVSWALIFVVIVLKVLHLVTDESWGGVGASLCYVRNIFGRGNSLGHLWSLSLEEQFYFVWPLLFVVFPKHRLPVALAVTVGVATMRAVGISFALFDVRTGVFYLRPWFRFDSVMAGCVLALVRQRTPRFFLQPPTWFLLVTHPLLGLSLLAALGYFEWAHALMPWALTLQTLVCVAILAGIAVGRNSWSNLVLRFGPLTSVGKVSYSLYVWQQLFVVTKVPTWEWVRRPPVDLVFAFACGILSWYLIERPFLKIKSRWSASRRGSIVV